VNAAKPLPIITMGAALKEAASEGVDWADSFDMMDIYFQRKNKQ
jgi:hypothetical protein